MNQRSIRHGSQGFTLVELMVGMLIGLVATVVMFQVFAVSESQKRTTTYAGDAQQNGAASLFLLERDARMAGYGFNYLPLLGCQVNAVYEPNTAFTFTLAPVVITNGAGGAPDTITFAYGSSPLFTQPAQLMTAVAANSPGANLPGGDPFVVNNRYGFNEGDVLVVGQIGQNCWMSQVTRLPGSPTANYVVHVSGTYVDDNGNTRNTLYNRPAGLGLGYAPWNQVSNTGGRLFNLGTTPVVNTYSVANGQLQVSNVLVPGQTQAISDGIVQLQAQYGYDGDGDGRIATDATSVAVITSGTNDQWGDAMPAAPTSADWQRVIAVRLVVVARSANPERKDSAGNCVATPAAQAPVWKAKNSAPLNVNSIADWDCYRYRTFEVVVPLRNMVWFAQPA